jgi:hypothetical protein
MPKSPCCGGRNLVALAQRAGEDVLVRRYVQNKWSVPKCATEFRITTAGTIRRARGPRPGSRHGACGVVIPCIGLAAISAESALTRKRKTAVGSFSIRRCSCGFGTDSAVLWRMHRERREAPERELVPGFP